MKYVGSVLNRKWRNHKILFWLKIALIPRLY